MTKSMEKAHLRGLMVENTSATIRRTRNRDTETSTGLMVESTLAIGTTVNSTESAHL
jgi:hypothetical protein